LYNKKGYNRKKGRVPCTMIKFRYLDSGMFVLIGLFKQKLFLYFVPVFRIRDPAPFDPRDPELVKNQDPDPG
jgi:hypothetical protein